MIQSIDDLTPVARPPDAIEDSYSVSPIQQGILFNSLYYAGSGVEIEQLVATLGERVDAGAMRQAFDRLVERHAILRTSFEWGESDPRQIVHAIAEAAWEEIDLRGLSRDDQEQRFSQFLSDDRRAGFDLKVAPITRIALFHLQDVEYRLVWTFHHIIIDGRTLFALLREVFQIYEALRDGRDLALPDPPPFRKFIGWLDRQDLTQAEDYWRNAMAGVEPTSLAAIFPSRPTTDVADRGVLPIRLSKQLTSDLLAKPYLRGHALQASWAILISRYTGKDDVVFGVIRSGRNAFDGADEIAGMLINTLPLRVQIPQNSSVLEWLRSMRAGGAQMRPHEIMPLADIQQWCGADAGSPLFDTLLGFESFELNAQLKAQGGEWDRREVALHEKAIYPLTVGAYLDDEMLVKFSYDQDRFTAAEIERMAGHFRTLLQAIVSNPECPISQLPMLSAVEATQLLVDWNETAAEYPSGRCLHELFEQRVAQTPGSMAVVFGEEQLTYAELNVRANRLAHYLRGFGIGPESLVGLCLDASLDLLVAIVGLHKAGGAYVPLDPSYPADRLDFMLRDSGVALLLTHEPLLPSLPLCEVQTICLDRDRAEIAREPDKNPQITVSPANAAYVIYTSGSTGRPKGVVVTHSGLGNVVANQQRFLSIGNDERIVQFASVSFDASVFDIVMALGTGSTLYLGSRESLLPGPPLTEFMRSNRITAATLPPTAVGPLNPEDLPDLRVLNVAGEACPLELGVRWSNGRRFFNLYGPTESTIWASCREIWPDCEAIDIGRPVGNSKLFVLDGKLRPVPVGVPGELFIGGISLARGYLNRPDLTAERFVPNPFVDSGDVNDTFLDSRLRGNDGSLSTLNSQLSTRLYRTGDLVRYLPDGNIEFLGRIDHQVKVRGYRIELGEIEAVLSQHPAVEHAVVVARDAGHGDSRLIAYVVSSNGAVNPNDLRDHLRERLPDYLLPATYVSLESLPLTPSGKIDRKALPIPESDVAVVRQQYAAPRTPIEEGLAEIWCAVLHVDGVGIHDRFFDLGGHSLLATQVIARVRSAFQVELPIQALFDAPTIATLAERIAAASGQAIEAAAPLVPVSRDEIIPASFSQQRLWFIHQLDPDSAAYNIPIAWRLTGDLDISAMEGALSALTERHESLRTTFAFGQGAPIQVVHPAQRVHLPIVDASESEAKALIAEDAVRPFDLERGPLFRVRLIRIGADEHILLFAMHHIISDGWSQGVLTQDLSALYNSFRADGGIGLPELPVQYADYTVWQRQRIQGEIFERQLAYWKDHLDGASTMLDLPADRRRPPVETFRGAWMPFELPAELSQGLRALGQREGATLFMTLMAAYQVLLARYSGQDDFVVGTPIANRTRTEVEGLIGFFVNTLALRADMSGDPSFRELILRVRQTALGAYANQDLPFERLVEELQPERTLNHSPLFQVVFALQNAPGDGLRLDGLQVTDASAEWTTAKFDLNLFLTPTGSVIKGALEYNTDLFEADRIERLLGHFRTLLEGIVQDPECPISRLPLLTEAESATILVDWVASEAAPAPDRCLHELFEEQAQRCSDAVAVVCEGEKLTYAELSCRANRLAHSLIKQGVGPDTLVGLCLERSLDMVVGVLGILKAGAAYVPLDPTYPSDRLAFMVSDAKLTAVVSNDASRERVPQPDACVISLDDPSLAGESASNPQAGATPGNLAYVIYTSGSTGRPKGALITHANVTRLMSSTWDWFKFDDTDVWTLFHSLSFDFSVWELWGPLLYGGRLVVVPYMVSRSPQAFRQLLIDEGVTVLNQTPSAFRQLIQADAESSSTSADYKLRYVVFGGEKLDLNCLEPWIDRHGDEPPRLINMYGITETTVHVTYRPIAREDVIARRGSLIGRAIPDLQVYVLGSSMEPVPIGVPGELYVGGTGLARGYLGRPELTAERFVPNPFVHGSVDGEAFLDSHLRGNDDMLSSRLYRTGDLVRWLPDGNMEYLRRADQQVKIRGFRIELGEIENVLRQHPAVREAVVITREDTPEDQRLAAYIVADREYLQAQDELRNPDEQQTADWQAVFESNYADSAVEDLEFNIRGWNSSYTGQPIPAIEMREWVDNTVERILSLNPQRVLEIGCGTGLLLFRVAPYTSEYTAVDFSSEALRYVEGVLPRTQIPADRITLCQSAAHALDYASVGPNPPDTVILNSIVQYFPNLDYLLDVLEKSLAIVSAGGRIFLGDIRGLQWLEEFQAAVQLDLASPATERARVWQRVQRAVAEEDELLLDPAFFYALRQRFPQIGRVDVQLKRGRFWNEMSQFRYDVVLHVSDSAKAVEVNWSDWNRDALSVAAISDVLQSDQDVLAISGVPNARMAQTFNARRLLADAAGPATVGEIRGALEGGGVDPDDFWQAAESFNYSVRIRPSVQASSFDAVFFREPADEPYVEMPDHDDRPLSSYANDPVRGKLIAALAPDLRGYAGERLPDYMVPSAFVFLDSLPLTANGKLDRSALPSPDYARIDLGQGYEPPQTPVEEELAKIWAEVLRLDRVGRHHDFFELGGHSLLATQAVSRIRKAFDIDLPLRALFETPSIAGLAERIESLRRESQSVLPPIKRISRDGPIPLSYSQQRLWFIHQLDPVSPAYNFPIALRLAGPLDIASLESSLTQLVSRHEVLRTTFALTDGVATQHIHEPSPVSLTIIDAGASCEDLIREEAVRPLDLEHGPLFRCSLLRVAQDEHVLLLTLHHVISDGWSLAVLIRELGVLYDAFHAGTSSQLPELAVQYADYSVWQRDLLESGDVFEDQLAYWRDKLAGAPSLLELPSDRPRPPVQSLRGALADVQVPERLTQSLNALAQREGATLFMVLLGAWQTLLHRYSGQTDIVVGTAIANRTCAETEGLLGCFINSLALRADLSGEPTLRELLARVRETALQAYAHQDLPFEKLVDEVQPERNLSHSPIFQVMFLLQNMPNNPPAMDGLVVESIPPEGFASKLDLTLSLTEEQGALTGWLEYSTDLFDAERVERMVSHYLALLEKLAADPGQSISRVSVLSESERRQLLSEWTATAAEYPVDRLIHELIEMQAEQYPESPAVEIGGTSIRYADLNHSANLLAHYLRRQGICVESRVGIYMQRSHDMIVALLAVLKAGGAYVPIDPDYPAERIAHILSDSRASALLTHTGMNSALPASDCAVINLDQLNLTNLPTENPPRSANPDNAAYVIYTSGSTGLPKGVVVSHRNLVHSTTARKHVYERPPGKFMLLSSIAFDSSIAGIFWTLCEGGCIVLPSRPVQDDLSGLLDEMSSNEVTHYLCVPSLHSVILDELVGSRIDCLKTVIVAGEECPSRLVSRHFEHLPNAALYNEYGPTEATVWSSVWHADRKSIPDAIPIGRSIPNAQSYVLDSRMQPVPIGIPGELYIGGEGVARCYLDRPDLTAERFVPNPFFKGVDSEQGSLDSRPRGNDGSLSTLNSQLSTRLYRTGDLVCWHASGELEFLGRVDHQVKIRGFRIELGEVENALAGCAGVRDAVVLAREDVAGERRLVAYVVGDVSSGQLREQLRAKLPDYMVPSVFVSLDSLPLSPNGKIDRNALPDPGEQRLERSYEPPTTPAEETLAAIWREVLRLERVGIHDNFFELGGDSILSIQIVARANRAGLRLTARQVFQYQTIAALAAAAGSATVPESDHEVVTGEAPLTPIQRWFFESNPSNPHHYNQALLLELRKPIDPVAVERGLVAMIAQHDAFRLRFTRSAAGWRQEYSSAPMGHFFTYLSVAAVPQGDRQEAITSASAETQASLNIESGPVIKAVYFDCGPDHSAKLLIAVHHLVMDGVSWRIILADLQTALEQLDSGEVPAFPPKTTSLKRWAERLVEHAQSDTVRDEIDHWLAQTPTTNLVIDYPNGSNRVADEHEVSVSLNVSETARLLAEAPVAYRTQINDLLITALLQAFESWTGERSVVLELEGHGREDLFEDVDLSRTVGWFTTLYPARLELPVSGEIGSAIKSVKEQLRRIPDHGIGYGLLRYLSEHAEISESLASIPRPNISFNYLGQLDQVLGESSPFALAHESPGPIQSPDMDRSNLLEVLAYIVNGSLQVRFSYSDEQFDHSTIESLAASYVENLRSLISHCITPASRGCTPSDFPAASISQESLDRLAAAIPDGIEDIYALSPMQAGMLFQTLFAAQPGVYLDQAVYSIEQELDLDAFQQSWQQLSMRHPALRTSIHWEGTEETLQVVHRQVSIPVEVRDLRKLDPVAQPSAIEAVLQQDREQGIDLTQPPLLRLTLLRSADKSWRFVWTGHHVLLDRWSVALVLAELADIYDADTKGRTPALQAIRPYGEYIAWIRNQNIGQAEDYWRRTLAGRLSPTTLPIDRNPAGPPGPDIEFERLILSNVATSDILTLARHHHLTLSALIQGAWALTLSRYSGESDVLFGATVAGRPDALPGVETMVGMFINSLPVHIQVSSDTPLLDWLRQIQDASVEMQEHSYCSLIQIQGWSEIPRGISLFDSLVVVQNTPSSQTEREAGLHIEFVDATSTADFPLMLVVGPADELFLELRYDASRYARQDIERMLGHVGNLLTGMAEDPSRPPRQIDLLSQPERRQLLDEWTDTTVEYPAGSVIHEFIEQQAERNPESFAVQIGGVSLSYADLNRRANQLASYLRELGVGVESRVGVFMPRSHDVVVALLGILKAGGAYVPIDPDYPAERIAHILSDSRASALLTHTAMISALPASGCAAINLDEVDLDSMPADNLPRLPNPDNAAYVIYTSGSTGLPKGVVVTHRNLVHSTTARKHVYEQPPDKFMLLSSIAFDSSIAGIFWTLTEGGCLVLPSRPVQDDLGSLLDEMLSNGVTHYLCVPSLHSVILEELRNGQLEKIITVIVAGEECTSRLVTCHFEQLPNAALYNEYGPTEATVWSSVWRADAHSIPDSIPIGRSIPNSQSYVLDCRMQPVPIGIPGELFIGGDGIPRGYLDRPGLTAERFVPNPFIEMEDGQDGFLDSRLRGNDGSLSTLNSQLSTRLYRTGDLVRWLASGELEFLGRVDHQVKIRGFRIELGEIENALLGCPGVREAVVLALDDTPGERRLVAYVVGDAGFGQLREQLRSKLPDYMVPSAFISLDCMPLSPNGKVDRQALPVPDTHDSADDVAGPRGPIEEGIAEIWREVLKLDRVGIHSSFFDLGGHSLLATQVVSRIRATFDVDLPIRTLFEQPTVAQLAIHVAESRGLSSNVPPIAQAPKGERIPLSYEQQRLYFVHKLDPDSPAYNIPCVLRIEGVLEIETLRRSIDMLVERHEVLRTTYYEEDGIPRQTVNPNVYSPLEIIYPNDERDAFRLAAEQSRRPFDLRSGPVIRATLYVLTATDHILCFTMHHIASDGWSIGVIVKELAQLYQSCLSECDPIPDLPVQYGDFAVWQRAWQQSEEMERQLSYWQQQLSGAPQTTKLPFDRARPTVPSLQGDSVTVETNPNLLTGLRSLGRLEGATLFMTLLACFDAQMYCISGSEDVVVGTDLAGRNRVELEGMVGFFINHLVLRTDLAGDPSFGELLGRVRRTALDAYDHQDTPFARLVETLQPDRESAHTPLFQTLFVMQNEMDTVVESGPLTLRLAGEAIPSAKFDLALFFLESIENGRRRLHANWVYSTDLFDRATIERMAGQFESVVAHVIANPGLRLSELKEALEADERNRRRADQQRKEAEQYSRFQKLKPKVAR